MVVLHQYHMSPYNEKLQRMLRYKGIEFSEQYWSLMQQKKLKQYNPVGKLPAVEYQGQWVCDSTDAAYFLEGLYPEPALIPPDAAGRAMVHVLEDWADESLYFYEMHLRFTTEGNWQRNLPRMFEHEGWFLKSLLAGHFPGQIRKGIQKITRTQGVGRKSQEQLLVDCRRHFEAVAGLLGAGQWLVGERLTLADLAVFGMFQCLKDTHETGQMLDGYPAIGDWMSRIEELTGSRPG
jgi:glutathione S-transferase